MIIFNEHMKSTYVQVTCTLLPELTLKAAFPFMRIIYPTDFVHTPFVRVTNPDETIFNVGVFFGADFCTIIYPCRNPHKRKHKH